MKCLVKLLGLHFFLFFFSALLFSQDCETCFTTGDCRRDLQKTFKIYSSSKGMPISTQDTIELNVVFYGQKEYIFSFCTAKEFYPIHFRILDSGSGVQLYDNSVDSYMESLGVRFDVARNLTIQVNVLGESSETTDLQERSGCLGVLIQYKDYDQ